MSPSLRTNKRMRPTRRLDGVRPFFLINTVWISSWKTPGNAGIGFTMLRYE